VGIGGKANINPRKKKCQSVKYLHDQPPQSGREGVGGSEYLKSEGWGKGDQIILSEEQRKWKMKKGRCHHKRG